MIVADRPFDKAQDRLKGRKTLQVTNFLDEFEKDDIRKDLDIIQLFNHFGVALKKKGKSFTGLCPWHEDKNPSLSVDREQGLYNCFGCGQSGDIFTLVEKMKGCTFKEACEFLKEFKGSQSEIFPPLAVPSTAVPFETKRKGTDELKERDTKKSDKEVPDKSEEVKSLPPDVVPPVLSPVEVSLSKQDLGGLGISLNTIAEYYHKKLFESTEALDYLKARGFTSTEIFSRFQIGFADGSLLEKLSQQQKKELKSPGIITDKGREHFTNCITFPIFDEIDTVVGMYGRSINEKSKVKHLYLKGKHRSVFNRKASKVYDEIILTESIIDALSLIELGIENVQSLYGTNGFTAQHLQLLKDDRVKTIILALDADEAGREASEKIKDQLIAEGFSVKNIIPASLPLLLPGEGGRGVVQSLSKQDEVKDWNEYMLNSPDKTTVTDLISTAEIFKSEEENIKTFTASKDNLGLLFTINEVTYRVTGVKEVFISNLRVNIKVENTTGDKYYDNLDLYSARSRNTYSQNLSRAFDVEPRQIEKDLILILEHLESERDRHLQTGNDKKTEVELTKEEHDLGMEFLTSPQLFQEVAYDMEVLGYVGEDLNKQLLYIAATSRKLDDPISVLIISQSASGKSYLVDTVKELIPPDEVISVTSLSDQALSYISDMEHKFLILSEAIHNDVVEHQLREMLSSKELSRMVAIKNPKTGQMTTQIVKTKTIVSTVMSSTNHNVNPENASRSFVIDTDESREQTRKIHEIQREKYTLKRYSEKTHLVPDIIKKHHAAQTLLIKRIIVNNFGKFLDFPDTLMRTRRDHDRFMDLIASICFIRQYQKEIRIDDSVEYIECDNSDYSIAYDIMVNGVLSSTMFDIPKGAIELYDAIREMAQKQSKKKKLQPNEITFSQRDIREYTGFGLTWVKQNLKILVDYEYIICTSGGTARRKGFYRIREDEPIESLNLSMIPTPLQIKEFQG